MPGLDLEALPEGWRIREMEEGEFYVTCVRCGSRLERGQNLEYYCEYCHEIRVVGDGARRSRRTCTTCTEDLEPGERVLTGPSGEICLDCARERGRICPRCERVLFSQLTLLPNDDGAVCGECFREVAFTCSDCRARYYHRNMQYISTGYGRNICETCYEEEYFTCDSCEQVWHRDCEQDGVCADCRQGDEDEEEYRERDSYGPIHDYCHKPPWMFYKLGGEKNKGNSPDYFGVELEVECGDSGYPTEVASKILEFSDNERMYFIKADSSLINGFEVVSHPCTLKYHQEEFGWKALCRLLRENHCKGGKRTSGIHIHMSKHGLSYPTQVKLGAFIELQEERMVKLARRKDAHYAEFKKLKKNHGGRIRTDDYHGYRTRWNYPLKKINTGHHSSAVNWGARGTVEVRMFQSSVNHGTVLASIELVHSIAQWAKVTSIARVADVNRGWNEYVRFIRGRKKEYPHLAPFMVARRVASNGELNIQEKKGG